MNIASRTIQKELLVDIDDIDSFIESGSDHVAVFRGLSLRVWRGELVALLGGRGSGKTTLLNLLGGIDTPQHGAIRFDGERIDRWSEARLTQWRGLNLGYVFGFSNLLPMLSVAQNVELPLLLSTLSNRQRQMQVAAALDIVGMAGHELVRPRDLDAAQQQRVAIARAIISDPQLILADEPTANLDTAEADALLLLLRALCRDFGKTVLIATVDARIAGAADRIVDMNACNARARAA